MQKFNSCNECVGSLGIIDDRTPDCHPSRLHGYGGVDNLKTERGSLMCLAYF